MWKMLTAEMDVTARGVCEARLKVAQSQVVRIEVEETKMLAKKTFFEKEAQGLRDMLEVY